MADVKRCEKHSFNINGADKHFEIKLNSGLQDDKGEDIFYVYCLGCLVEEMSKHFQPLRKENESKHGIIINTMIDRKVAV